MEETKVVFDAEAASRLVEELRGGFTAGKTRTYEWRMSQLKGIMKIVEDHEQEIVEALRSDLSKPELEAVIYEVLFYDRFFPFFLENRHSSIQNISLDSCHLLCLRPSLSRFWLNFDSIYILSSRAINLVNGSPFI